MVSVSASVNLPLHHKVQKFSSSTSSPGWSRKKGRKTVVVWCGGSAIVDGAVLNCFCAVIFLHSVLLWWHSWYPALCITTLT